MIVPFLIGAEFPRQRLGLPQKSVKPARGIIQFDPVTQSPFVRGDEPRSLDAGAADG